MKKLIEELGRVQALDAPAERDLTVQKLADDGLRTIMAVTLKNGAIIARHKAADPITVLCIGGSGEFSAGPEMSETVALLPGSLISLDGNIDHEVKALPELQIVVTKYKNAS